MAALPGRTGDDRFTGEQAALRRDDARGQRDASGVHPAILVDGGLRPALKALARRSAIPARVDFRVEGRLPTLPLHDLAAPQQRQPGR
jgi:hypothetical protein